MSIKNALCLPMALVALASVPVSAQQGPGPVTLAVHALKGGVYWVSGGRSNSGFVVGDTGVVVIDAQYTADDARKELAQIAMVTPKAVNTAILTHADPDHIGGVPGLPVGTAIIAQENARAEIEASAAAVDGGPVNGPLYRSLAAGYLPQRTVGATQAMTLDGVRMVLMYVAPAHTSGDLIVYLPAQKVVFGGDIVTTNIGRFPVVHIGGSSLGWMEAVRAILALKPDTIVSGHGEIESRAQLQARLRDAEERREHVKAMVYAGKSEAEVVQALPEVGSSPMFPSFTQTVYREIANGYPPASPPWKNLVHR